MFWIWLSCTAETYDYSFDAAQHKEQTQETCVEALEISHRTEISDFLLGIKVFSLSPSYEEMYSFADYEALPLNTVGVLFTIPYNEQGFVQYPYSIFDRSIESFSDHLCQVGRLIHSLKSEGYYIYLSIEPHFYDKEQWASLNNFETKGPPSLTVFDDSVAETFLNDVHPYLQEIAEMAETYKVDLAAPITEPGKYFGLEPINDFMAQARSDFASYSGRLVWQVYGEEFLVPEDQLVLHRYDFSGYDTLGLAVLGCDQPTYAWDRYIDTLWSWAQEDGVDEVFHAEFGCVSAPESQEVALDNLWHWYERIMPESLGVVVLDAPNGGPENPGIVGTWLEDWMRAVAEENQ